MTKADPINLQIESLTAQSTIGDINLRQKSAFSVQHLIAAARFSRQCGEVQDLNKGKELGAFYDEQISCVSAVVMLSVASIESNINEYLSEPDIIFPKLAPSVQIELCSLIGSLSIIEKYQRILSINNIEVFDKGAQPLQDIETLISLRNEFVHFHPEWHDEQERHKKLGMKLRGKFELSPFISESIGVLFPQRIVSHGCSKWAVQKSIEFMSGFNKKLSLKSKLKRHMGRLNA